MTLSELRNATVGELAVTMPSTIRVFEAWKIDYCCGGKTPLPVACANAGKNVEEFLAELDRQESFRSDMLEWNLDGLTTMGENIVSSYHVYTREELRTITPLADKVLSVHGERRPELAEVVSLIAELTKDMVPHMLKEEQVLFPYVAQLEETAAGRREAPTPFFGTVKNPVRMMMIEHDRVGELLVSLRRVTEEFTPPESACFSYRELYRRLEEFERRTHEHVHVENNIYFPRAVALEETLGNTAPLVAAAGGCGAGCEH